jgi:hypothetical protein
MAHHNHKLQISFWEKGQLVHEVFEHPTQDGVYRKLEEFQKRTTHYTFKVYNGEDELLESKGIEIDTYA